MTTKNRCDLCHAMCSGRRLRGDPAPDRPKLCHACYLDAKRDAQERETIRMPLMEIEIVRDA